MRIIAVCLLGGSALAATVLAQSAQPDLQGVWNFSTLTPLERPAEFAAQPFLTDAQAAAFEDQTIGRNDRDRRDGGAATDVGRAVNDYWFDRGTHVATLRTSRFTSSRITSSSSAR